MNQPIACVGAHNEPMALHWLCKPVGSFQAVPRSPGDAGKKIIVMVVMLGRVAAPGERVSAREGVGGPKGWGGDVERGVKAVVSAGLVVGRACGRSCSVVARNKMVPLMLAGRVPSIPLVTL